MKEERHMKKRLLSLTAMLLVLAMLAACGSTAATPSATPTVSESAATAVASTEAATAEANADAEPAQTANAPVTLTFFHEAAMTESEVTDLANNNVLKYIEAQTNIKLNFIMLNATEGKQKMILSFASGDYPDGGFLDWNTLFTRAEVMQYGVSDKILLPLNQYIDKSAVELKKIFDLRPNAKAAITAPDGNIYGLPRFSECGHCMSYPKLWVNYDWMEKLGIKEPTTTAELEAMLLAFKTKDPNGNGKADEIALTGATEWSCPAENYLMNSFIYLQSNAATANPVNYISLDASGKPLFVANKPAFLTGLTWMKKLYDQELIDPAAFTQTAENLAQQCRSDAAVATVGAYTCDHMAMGIDFANKEINAQYHALPPVAGPDGVRFQPYTDFVSQMSGFHFVLFDKCTNPEAAFRLADWMLSEDNLPILSFGMENVTWKKPADANAKNIMGSQLKWIPIPLPQNATQAEKDTVRQNSFWFGFMGDLLERRAEWSPAATEESLISNYETRLEFETQKTVKYWPKTNAPRSLFMEKADSDKYTEELMNINSHVRKNMAMFITGARPLAEWDAYVNELNQFNVEDYLSLYTKGYDAYVKNVK